MEKHFKTHKKHLIENGSFHTLKPRKPCHYWADGVLKKTCYFYIIKIRKKLIKKSIFKTNVFLEWTQSIYKSRWQNCPCFFFISRIFIQKNFFFINTCSLYLIGDVPYFQRLLLELVLLCNLF